jgi:inosine-uridine nucleoside N-ribohydrolase
MRLASCGGGACYDRRVTGRVVAVLRARAVLAVLLGLGLLIAGGCSAAAKVRPAPAVPVAIDTDLGADDILAVLYLLGRPEVDVVAVTVVGDGLVHCPTGAANARAILAAAGRGSIPVACGAQTPIAPAVAFPDPWRAQADELYGMARQWPAAAAPTGATDAEQLLVEAAVHHPGLRILALGPLSDVAIALRHADVVAANPTVVVSGGAVGEPGNMSGVGSPAVEWNIGADPVAAAAVLHARVPTTWVTLDASNDVPVDMAFLRALAGQPRSLPGDLAAAFLQTNSELGRGGFFFWDPLAAVTITTPDTVTYRDVALAVETVGPEAGRTTADRSGVPTVVTAKADAASFTLAMLRGFAPAGAPTPTYAPKPADVRLSRPAGERFQLDAPAILPAGDTTISFDARDSGAYVVVIGRIAPGHGYAEVVAAVAGGVTSAPAWFTVEVSVDVPAGSRPTWVVSLPAGVHALVAAEPDGSKLAALGAVTTQ